MFQANGNQKAEEITILIPDKVNFNLKKLKRDKDSHYPSRSCNNCKYLHAHRRTQISKAKAENGKSKHQYDNILDFDIPFSTMDKSDNQ